MRHIVRYVWIACLLAMLPGCGRTLYPAAGQVTLNGKPLAGAIVAFLPDDKGLRPIVAVPDADGHYQLQLKRGQPGACVGRYTVRITTYREGNPNSDPPIPAVEEKVPEKYNLQSDLHADVRPQPNQLDFRLETGR